MIYCLIVLFYGGLGFIFSLAVLQLLLALIKEKIVFPTKTVLSVLMAVNLNIGLFQEADAADYYEIHQQLKHFAKDSPQYRAVEKVLEDGKMSGFEKEYLIRKWQSLDKDSKAVEMDTRHLFKTNLINYLKTSKQPEITNN